ncbi:MAG: YfhO family protein, partial [Bryobacteraceae bacterium]
FVLTVGVHWKTLLTNQYQEFDKPDLTLQAAPWLQVQAAAWHHRHPLLWDPYQVGGQSLIGQSLTGAAYPFNWLLFLAPLKNGFIRDASFNWYIALIRFMGALACYALCRDLGRSATASILGACAFAFAGYLATTAWPYMLNGAVWAPLVFLFSLRAIRGDRPLVNAVTSGGFLGIAWLSGHHQIPIFTGLAIAGVWIYQIARKRRREELAYLAALIVTMVLVSAVQTFPAYSYAQSAVRWVNASHEVTWNQAVPYSVHDEFSLPPASVLGVFLQSLFTNSNPFVGIVVLALAILAVALAWSEFSVRIFAGVALGGIVFAFASPTIFHGIIYALLPFADKARNPAMAVFIFHLGVCVLAACGADALADALTGHAQSVWVKRVMIGCGAVAVAIWIFEAVVFSFHTPVTARTSPIAVTGLVAVLLIVLLNALRAGSIQARSAPVLLVVLVMLEIGSLTQADLQNRDLGFRYWNLLTRDADLAGFLKSRPGPVRADFKDEDVPYNFGDWYGVESYMGYVASAPEAFTRVQADPRTHDLFGVRYYVARQTPRAGLTEVFSSAAGIKVFESASAMPRAWTAHETFPIHNLEELGPHLSHPSVDFNRLVLLMGDLPPLENCSGDQVRLTRHDAQHADLDVEMNCRGMVVLADGYSKDWVAMVDGKRSPVYAAYGVIRGVVVDRGHHRIEMRYRPASIYLGGALTVASLLAAGLLRLFSRPRG